MSKSNPSNALVGSGDNPELSPTSPTPHPDAWKQGGQDSDRTYKVEFLQNDKTRSASYATLMEALERARGIGTHNVVSITGPNCRMDPAAVEEWCRKNPPPGTAYPKTA